MFNDTSRYLDDIFTIDSPEFEKHIPDIYPAELEVNKADTSDKETSFLDLSIKAIGSDIDIGVYNKRGDFEFPIVNFPWLSGDVPREKERDLTQSYDKSPYTDRKIQKATWSHKNATKNFDFTTISDQLRTVSWGNDSHPTGVVKPVYGIPIVDSNCTVFTFWFAMCFISALDFYFKNLQIT